MASEYNLPPSPPLLIGGDSSDGEEDRDGGGGGHGCLVIGKRLLLSAGSFSGERESESKPSSSELVEERSNRDIWIENQKIGYIKPSQRGRNDLSRRVAEVALQHPEYGGLQAAVRENVWDCIDREHPNSSSRIDLRRFDVRLSTFPSDWHRSLPPPDQLARVGLYSLGMEDRVGCFSCGIQLEEWGEEEPLTRHCLASPSCPFLLQDFPEQLEAIQRYSSSEFSNTSVRLHSFSDWPLSSVVTSYQLASVGFYYTGEGARVVCFCCGLEVRDWRKGDVPLLVHCRANPECSFIKSIIKGSSLPDQAPPPVLRTSATDSSNRPNYSELSVRLQSFKKLSPAFPIPRLQLAEAGLFLLRLPDVMRCHSCDTVLQGWMEGDMPVEKHQAANPDCPFLAERFPSKLRVATAVDPSTLPAAEFDERELEMMARQQPPSLASSSHHSSNHPDDSLSLASLALSDTHTLSPSLSTYSPHSHLPTYTERTSATPTGAAQMMAPSTWSVGGKTVSLPPSYSTRLSQHHTGTEKPMTLPAGAECVVCMDKPLEMVFVPCGHICVCEECSAQITRCPICRSRTQMAVKVYYPY